MRLPREIHLCNIPFKVKCNHERYGSSFSYKTAIIKVGTAGSSREALEGFLHEVAEISMVERGMRASKCKPQVDGDYVFHGSHQEFQMVMCDVSGVVADMMKLR